MVEAAAREQVGPVAAVLNGHSLRIGRRRLNTSMSTFPRTLISGLCRGGDQGFHVVEQGLTIVSILYASLTAPKSF